MLGQRTITDLPMQALALITLVVLWRWKKLPEPFIVIGAALIGLLLYPVFHH